MRIIFTVTTNPAYDQRMIRICNSLTAVGHQVTLIGVRLSKADESPDTVYTQKKIRLFFKKGFLFYAEYNLKLFFVLLLKKADVLGSIDLDTILPVYLVSKIKRVKRVHDAHEYFSQMKEVITRPHIYRFWHWMEKTFLPKFPHGYTVSGRIAKAFEEQYGVQYRVIRNIPIRRKRLPDAAPALPDGLKGDFLLYQGSVNEARGFEYLIPAMRSLSIPLLVAGHGNFYEQAQALVHAYKVTDQVFFLGKFLPEELAILTPQATIGLNLIEPVGLSQTYSLANKFFDYIHAGVPQITMNYPEYRDLNNKYHVAFLLEDLTEENILTAVTGLLEDKERYLRLKRNCLTAACHLNWQMEESYLHEFYVQIEKQKGINNQ